MTEIEIHDCTLSFLNHCLDFDISALAVTHEKVGYVVEKIEGLLRKDVREEFEETLLSVLFNFLATISARPEYDYVVLHCCPYPAILCALKVCEDCSKITEKIMKIVANYAQSKSNVSIIIGCNLHLAIFKVFEKKFQSTPNILGVVVRAFVGIRIEMEDSARVQQHSASTRLVYEICQKLALALAAMSNSKLKQLFQDYVVFQFLQILIADDMFLAQSDLVKRKTLRICLSFLQHSKHHTSRKHKMLYCLRNFIPMERLAKNIKTAYTEEEALCHFVCTKSKHGRIMFQEGAYDVLVKMIDDCDDEIFVAIATQIIARISFYGCRRKIIMTQVRFKSVYMNLAELVCHFCSKDHALAMYNFLRFSMPIDRLVDAQCYPFTPQSICTREKNYEVARVLRYWSEHHNRLWRFKASGIDGHAFKTTLPFPCVCRT